MLFRFLSGAAMPWRRMWVGSLLGSAALTVLQLLGGAVLSVREHNPLLATFAVFIGLLLWFRLTSIVILVAASWIAVEASDAHETLRMVTPEQLAAEERAREQQRARDRRAACGCARRERGARRANWFERIPARRRLAEGARTSCRATRGRAGAPRAGDEATSEGSRRIEACPPKPLRIASVNVNGVRAAFRKGMGEWLAGA